MNVVGFKKPRCHILFMLILKKRRTKDLKDSRFISLIGVLYKLLAKVLANGLKKVVGQEVHKSYNVFLKGRQIIESMLIANKAIDSTLNSDAYGVV